MKYYNSTSNFKQSIMMNNLWNYVNNKHCLRQKTFQKLNQKDYCEIELRRVAMVHTKSS